ncbi:hypothetical protein CGCF415_v011118 [Colletotrichum fructicola]|uniref:Ethyl tert-butyl ether degradation n=1 Tax=Colletotrichum fructicola (strain Nara gc5) TaxID=1213859 RepID=L2FE66_COLFN|nr:uncharacterized protein CGMCC3_g13339 [Colletotrichum fructicola]KAI8287158.1 hypothetical protein K4K60_012785 [Colletotrichum sp. SAR11_57]KAE9570498.1 hypothetical protein CGMCC3_g13339 [Colletotrichum fructicola]KAF4884262.1 hypothetical protein CGCFRS4_v012867 [Colletotrichum fructicola]KAF4897575.1 hypothetical protein CGCF415_v011118 [Colletotrichum fructicola]KAF4930852.1 hypothetical protein CGCF245_v011499 [Colletotrichum fructicola]
MVRIVPFTVTAMLFASSVAICTRNGLTQMLTHVKRHPSYTQTEFWDYWYTQHAPKVAPLASYFNISRYQQVRDSLFTIHYPIWVTSWTIAYPSQVRIGGLVLPTEAGATEPASDVPVEFDGVAMFLYRSPDDLAAMISHPYYTEVVLPDEGVFIDKSAFGGGQVASFVGAHFEVVDDKKDIWIGSDADREKYQQLFDSYN